MRKIASRFAMWIVMLAVLLSLSITAMAVNSTTTDKGEQVNDQNDRNG